MTQGRNQLAFVGLGGRRYELSKHSEAQMALMWLYWKLVVAYVAVARGFD